MNPTIDFDLTSAEYQTRFNLLSSHGMRPVAVAMRQAGLFSAAWVPNTNNIAFVACNGLEHNDFAAWVTTWMQAGYEIKAIACATVLNISFAPAYFSAVMEQTATGVKFEMDLTSGSDQDPATLQNHLGNFQNPALGEQKYVPRAVAGYSSTNGSPLFAVAWEPTQENWTYRLGDIDVTFQSPFNAYVNDLSYRCSLLVYLPDSSLFSVFRDDSVGSWYAYNGKTQGQMSSTFAALAAQGIFPSCLTETVGLSTDGPVAAVYMATQTPLPRQWTAEGPDLASLSTSIDPIIKLGMTGNGTPWGGQIRAASVAITYDQRLVFARAYTWADPGYPITTPTSIFRIASCSKPITSIAVGQLIQNGLLSPTDTVSSKVPLTTPPLAPGTAPQPFPAGYENITVAELRSHRSGLVANNATDFGIAAAYGVSTPISIDLYAGYEVTGTFLPGYPSPTTLTVHYANINYLLLGLVVRNISGQSYGEYVSANIFQKLGLTRPVLGKSLHSQRAQSEVQLHCVGPAGIGDNAAAPQPPLVGNGYGIFRIENAEGFGDWVMCPADYVAILASLGTGQRTTSAILNQQSIQTMFTKLDPSGQADNFTAGGLFWAISPAGVDVFAHNGAWEFGGADCRSWVMSRTDPANGKLISIAIFANNDVDAGPNNATGPLDSNVWAQNNINVGGPLQSLLDTVTTWPTTGDLFPEFGIPAIA